MVFGLITSSLLFGLFHDNVLGMFGFGIVMSVLLLRTKSLHYSILCHMCNNTIPYIIKIGDSFGTDEYESTLTIASLRDYFPIMFIVFIISISLIIRYTYKTVKNFAIPQE
jgi:CAAX amino terminal protease family.